MDQARNHPFRIPHARAGKISDDVLDHVAQVAEKAQQGHTLSDSEAKLILLTAPQVCIELRQRRAAMDLIGDCVDLENVRFLNVPAVS